MDDSQANSHKIDLVSQQVIAEQPLRDEFLLYEVVQVIYELFIFFEWHFPKIDACRKETGQSSLHLLECLPQRLNVEFFNFSEIFVIEFFKDHLDIWSKSHRFIMMFVEDLHAGLETLAVSVDVGFELEAIDDSLLFCLVFQIVHNHLHVNF